MRRAIAVIVALAAGFAAPSALAAPKAVRCAPPKVTGPEGYEEPEREKARRARVLRITDANDKAHPVVVTYAHQPGATVFHQADVGKELIFHTVQVVSKAARANLWLRAEFPEYATDIDLYVWAKNGDQVGYSESSNNEVEDAIGSIIFYPLETGGPGFENINGMPVRRCDGYSVETQNSFVLTRDTPVRVTMWLGPPGKGGH